MIVRSTLIWGLILVLAILNGGFREIVVSPRFGAYAGHVSSTCLLSALILLTAWRTMPWIRPDTRRAAWMIGGWWLVLTIAFEFLAGHWVFGRTWQLLLADYDILHGRVWLLVLLATFTAPRLAVWVRGH